MSAPRRTYSPFLAGLRRTVVARRRVIDATYEELAEADAQLEDLEVALEAAEFEWDTERDPDSDASAVV